MCRGVGGVVGALVLRGLLSTLCQGASTEAERSVQGADVEVLRLKYVLDEAEREFVSNDKRNQCDWLQRVLILVEAASQHSGVHRRPVLEDGGDM